jgi:hypothetical protein
MKTRTLLLLALACGVAIMVAGAVLLIQLSSQDDAAPPVAIGDAGVAGDMTVIVDDSTERGGVLDVVVRIGGVDDPDGADGFRLIAGGRAVSPATGDGLCGATTTAERRCTVRFDVDGAGGASRVLFYERGDVTLRWVLA